MFSRKNSKITTPVSKPVTKPQHRAEDWTAALMIAFLSGHDDDIADMLPQQA
jgi:hypothetical protein